MPITASHTPAPSVLRMKPRRCACQAYSRRAPIAPATSRAIRFSNPCSRALEKGRLLGSAQTRITRSAPADDAHTTTAPTRATTLRKREHIDRAPLPGVARQIFGGADEAQRGRFVAGVEIAGD